MLFIISCVIIGLYFLVVVLIFLYSLAQLNLLVNYLLSKRKQVKMETFDFCNVDEIPQVTIQLPLYNEKYVVERLLEAVTHLNYPKHKLDIQVLDDSTDDSILLTHSLVQKYADAGFDIHYIRRRNRQGFKAGALKEGLNTAKGDYIVIFDADFLPEKDWLYQTIPHFKDPKVGVIQTRWGHINRDHSILTQVQALALDAHFTLEQTGRNTHHHFINFNGTAGAWRKSCIFDAGNWESDTLTEDLDLSYRAQLKKWKFVYLEDVATPAELPAILSAARTQQFRWNKGGAQNFVKMASRVVAADTISAKTKIHGILHLLNSSLFLCIFVMSILSVPVLYIKHHYDAFDPYFGLMIFFFITTIIYFFTYWVPYKNIQGFSIKNFFTYFVLFFGFMSIALGLSYQNTIAVLEGFLGKKSEFVRTPKLNIEALKDRWKENIYISKDISKYALMEGVLFLYYGFAVFSAFWLDNFSFFPFHVLLFAGFGYVTYQSVKPN